jgi:hypothetical protein
MTKRPRRANSSLSIVRGIKTQKAIYWTKSKLQKLLPGMFSPGREAYFARAMMALREWPELSGEQIIEATSRINPRRLMGGRWAWPKSDETLMREYADRAPNDAIDPDKLREAFADMNRRTRERFMELVVERVGELPATKETEIDWRLFRRIVRRHAFLMDLIRKHHDPDFRGIDISQRAILPGREELRHDRYENSKHDELD